MAISDMFGGAGLVTNILMKLRVDTTDAKKGLKELTGEEKKAAQAAIDLQEKKNKQMESWSKGIAKVTVGMQLAQKAVGFLGDAWKQYEKHAKAAGGADAAKAKAFREALDTMGRAVDKIAVEIGGLVASLAPLVEMAAALVGVIGEGLDMLGRGRGWIRRQLTGPAPSSADEARFQEWQRSQGYGFNYADAASFYGPAGRMAMSSMGIAQQGQIDARMAGMGSILRGAKTEMNKDPGDPWSMDQLIGRSTDMGAAMDRYTFDRGIRAEQRVGSSPSAFATGLGGIDIQSAVPSLEMINAALEKTNAFSRGEEKKSIFEQIFGPPEEFDAYKMKLELLAGALNVVGGALQSSFDAWVNGSMSAGEAFKKFGTDVVVGMSKMLMATAIQEGVAAVVSLARYDFKGAAEHGKAAGMAAAGAVAVGAIARQIGGNASGGGGGYGGVPSVTGGGGGGGSQGSSVTVIMANDFDDSPRMRQRRFGRAVGAARRYEGQDGVILQ